MGLSAFNQRRAREAEKAKLLQAQEPKKVEVIEEVKLEPIEDVESLSDEAKDFLTGKTDELPKECEEITVEEVQTLQEKPKKKTDAEKLKKAKKD